MRAVIPGRNMAARVGITTKAARDVLVVLRRDRGEYDGDDDISYVFRMCVVYVSYVFRMRSPCDSYENRICFGCVS